MAVNVAVGHHILVHRVEIRELTKYRGGTAFCYPSLFELGPQAHLAYFLVPFMRLRVSLLLCLSLRGYVADLSRPVSAAREWQTLPSVVAGQTRTN